MDFYPASAFTLQKPGWRNWSPSAEGFFIFLVCNTIKFSRLIHAVLSRCFDLKATLYAGWEDLVCSYHLPVPWICMSAWLSFFLTPCRRSNREWWRRQHVFSAASESQDALESLWQVPECSRDPPAAPAAPVPAAEAHGDGGHWLLPGTVERARHFYEDRARDKKLLPVHGRHCLLHLPLMISLGVFSCCQPLLQDLYAMCYFSIREPHQSILKLNTFLHTRRSKMKLSLVCSSPFARFILNWYIVCWYIVFLNLGF